MKLILDIVLLIIVALCTWGGYKRGLIGGVAGILAIVIALFGGSLLSSAYAHEVVPALEPFVDGYIDSQVTRDEVLRNMGYGNTEYSVEDILAQDSSLRYDYAYECMLEVGVYPDRAEELADRLRGLQCHVNLIPLNPVAERGLKGVTEDTVRRFMQTLERRHISVTRRREMGDDIEGACGQLRRSTLAREEER